MTKREAEFQRDVIVSIKNMFPNSIIMKLDENYIQGIPDLLILYNNKWAVLECKRSKNSAKQPNQEYYVTRLNAMSFSRFIYPENMQEVLSELQRTFES